MIELPSTIEEEAVEGWEQQLVRAGERVQQSVCGTWCGQLNELHFASEEAAVTGREQQLVRAGDQVQQVSKFQARCIP